MSRLVRIVQVVDADADALRSDLANLPHHVHGTVVPTAAGALVTLTQRYRAIPGGRGRALRMLRHQLDAVLGHARS